MDEKDYRRRSNTSGENYDFFKTVKIKNPHQAAIYMDFGVNPVDVRSVRDEDGKLKIVFYFDKEESKEVFDLWCRHELS